MCHNINSGAFEVHVLSATFMLDTCLFFLMQLLCFDDILLSP